MHWAPPSGNESQAIKGRKPRGSHFLSGAPLFFSVQGYHPLSQEDSLYLAGLHMGCLFQLSKYENYDLVNYSPLGQKAVGAKGSQILKIISSTLTAHCRWEMAQRKFQVNKLSYKCYQILWMSNGWNPGDLLPEMAFDAEVRGLQISLGYSALLCL